MKHEVHKSLTVEKTIGIGKKVMLARFLREKKALNLSLKVFDRYNNNMHTSASDLELRARL